MCVKENSPAMFVLFIAAENASFLLNKTLALTIAVPLVFVIFPRTDPNGSSSTFAMTVSPDFTSTTVEFVLYPKIEADIVYVLGVTFVNENSPFVFVDVDSVIPLDMATSTPLIGAFVTESLMVPIIAPFGANINSALLISPGFTVTIVELY